jgi:ubiquinone biosynthesis protein Coq4
LKNASEVSCRENEDTYFVMHFSKYHDIYVIITGNTAVPDRPRE